jgi:phytoene/squalene synthetase
MNKQQERMVIELWIRIRDRIKDEITTRETDLKILEKWRKDFDKLKEMKK